MQCSEIERHKTEAEQQQHLSFIQAEHKSYQEWGFLAKTHPHEYMSIIMDGASALKMPHSVLNFFFNTYIV